MKNLTKIVYVILAILTGYYLLIPDGDFPDPPPGSVQSFEPADTETPLRRAYFTDLSREQVIEHYKKQLNYLPILRLNYPPEDAQWIIRDQTRSYYLEELVQPLRSSIFINGFIPQTEKDKIVVNGIEYYQKLTIRYVPSDPMLRIFIVGSSLILLYLVLNEWKDLITSIWSKIK